MMPMDTDCPVAEKPVEVRAAVCVDSPRRLRAGKMVERGLLLITAVFFALHFVHLKADFPNHSPWMDWAKYTDEGWYGDAAIRHYALGHWYVAGDFNAAAALPVWPAVEMAVFGVTGVSLVAARALTVTVFGLILVCGYGLIRRWAGGTWDRRADETAGGRVAASLAVLLLAVNPMCFVFSRLAILEPLLILLTLVALLVGSAAGAASAEAWGCAGGTAERRVRVRAAMSAAGLGMLLPLIVLTKTTGLFLFPAIFWLMWAATGYRVRAFVRAAGVAGGVAAVGWAGYYLLFVRPHYLIDYRYLFSANAYTGITAATFWTVVRDALLDVSWIGTTLSVLAMVTVVGWIGRLGVGWIRGGRGGNPLVVALLLWVFGYGAFLAYHANLQPRYYLVLAVPLMMLTAVGYEAVSGAASGRGGGLVRVMGVVLTGALGFVVVSGAVRTVGYVLRPEYRWWSAAQQVREIVDREAKVGAGHSRMVLSISGSDLSLMTGLPSICDDFGTMTLPERVAAYRPGWFATWNDVEDDKMEALAPLFHLERVATIPVFDDPDRNVLILYRLDALSSPGGAGRLVRRRFLSVPRRLRTRVGEQPSAVQLRH
jgi:hypothetical protein